MHLPGFATAVIAGLLLFAPQVQGGPILELAQIDQPKALKAMLEDVARTPSLDPQAEGQDLLDACACVLEENPKLFKYFLSGPLFRAMAAAEPDYWAMFQNHSFWEDDPVLAAQLVAMMEAHTPEAFKKFIQVYPDALASCGIGTRSRATDRLEAEPEPMASAMEDKGQPAIPAAVADPLGPSSRPPRLPNPLVFHLD